MADSPLPNSPSPDSPLPNSPSPDSPLPDSPSPNSPLPNSPSPDSPLLNSPSPNSPLPKKLKWSINPEYKNQPTFLGHIALSGSLILLALISYLIMFFAIAPVWEENWLNCLSDKEIKAVQLPAPDLNSVQINDKVIPVSISEKTRIKSQFADINSRAGKHCRIMAFFYKQYFISLLIGGVAGIVAVICLFFLSKKGWEETNNALNNIFVTSFGIALVFVNTIIMFKEAENLKASQDLFIAYIALSHELYSYWATGKQFTNDTTKGVAPADFIYYMDSKIQALNQVKIGFDPTPLFNIQGKVGQSFGFSQNDVSAPTPKSSVPVPAKTPVKP